MKSLCLIPILGFLSQGDPLPLSAGGSWTYVVEERTAEAVTSSREVVARIGATREIGGERWTEVANWLGYERCWLSATPDTIRLRLETNETAPSLTIIRLDAKPGTEWTGTLGGKRLHFRLEGLHAVTFGKENIRAMHISVDFGGHEGHSHPAPRGLFRFAAGIGILEARLSKDLDCHSAATRTYRLRR